jgi:hypothetical protein
MMSLLYPLYALAALAIAAPVLFHLVRRKPKEKLDFSSTLFLDPAPPKLTKHSQIDQWLLLLLRAAAVLLVAFAFSRPYWDVPVASDSVRSGIRRMVLVDNSASMQRGDLLEKAKRLSGEWVAKADPNDVVSVYSFSSDLKPYFSTSEALQASPDQRQQLAQSAISQIPATWLATNLGRSVSNAIDLLQRDDNLEAESAASTLELIVVSDFQQGNRMDELSTIQWPEGCQVRLVPVNPPDGMRGNASHRMIVSEGDEPIEDDLVKQLQQRDTQSAIRVRVTNSPQSKEESFALSWIDRNGNSLSASKTPIAIPAGQTKVARIPLQPEGAVAIRLSGDREAFDNDHFVAPSVTQSFEFWCIEESRAEDTTSASFFLKQLPLGDSIRTVQFSQKGDLANTKIDPKQVPALVLVHGASPSTVLSVRQYLEDGGRVLWVWNKQMPNLEASVNEAAVGLFDANIGTITEAKVSDYSLLQDIDYSSSLFRDFSDAKFSDFTRVRFWRHRCLTPSEPDLWKVIAKFDDRFPAVLQRNIKKGTLTVMTAGWEPEESQLALSSKFVPLLSRFVDESLPAVANQAGFIVGDHFEGEEVASVIKPNGERIDIEPGQISRVVLDIPGLYERIGTDGSRKEFAVNIAASESLTAPMDPSQIAQFGMPLEERSPNRPTESMQRQLRAVELESQQSPWRWLLLSVLILVACESLISLVGQRAIVKTGT